MENLKSLIIFSSVLLVLIILTTRYRKSLGLLVIKLVYGKYSYEYLTSFKRMFVRSPFQYCFRDEFISHVLYVLDKNEKLSVHKTSGKISFENEAFFRNYKEVLKKRGEPHCFNAFAFDDPEFIIKVLGYRETVAGLNGTSVYYFIDDIFFMGEYIFKESPARVKEKFIQPYINLENIKEDNFYIENTNDRIIHYQDNGFSIDIKYLDREDESIINTLKSYHDRMTNRTLVVES